MKFFKLIFFYFLNLSTNLYSQNYFLCNVVKKDYAGIYDLEVFQNLKEKIGSLTDVENVYQSNINGAIYFVKKNELYSIDIVEKKIKTKFIRNINERVAGTSLPNIWVEIDNYYNVLKIESLNDKDLKKIIKLEPMEKGFYHDPFFISDKILCCQRNSGSEGFDLVLIDIESETVIGNFSKPYFKYFNLDDFEFSSTSKKIIFKEWKYTTNSSLQVLHIIELDKHKKYPETTINLKDQERLICILNDSILSTSEYNPNTNLVDINDTNTDSTANNYTSNLNENKVSFYNFKTGKYIENNLYLNAFEINKKFDGSFWTGIYKDIVNTNNQATELVKFRFDENVRVDTTRVTSFDYTIEQFFLLPEQKNELAVIEVPTRELIIQNSNNIERIQYTKDGKYFIGIESNSISLWDARNFLLLRNISNNCFNKIVEVDSLNTIITNECGEVYNFRTGKLIKKIDFPDIEYTSPYNDYCIVKQYQSNSSYENYRLRNISQVNGEENYLIDINIGETYLFNEGKLIIFKEHPNRIETINLSNQKIENKCILEKGISSVYRIEKTNHKDIIRIIYGDAIYNKNGLLNEYLVFYDINKNTKLLNDWNAKRLDIMGLPSDEDVLFSKDKTKYLYHMGYYESLKNAESVELDLLSKFAFKELLSNKVRNVYNLKKYSNELIDANSYYSLNVNSLGISPDDRFLFFKCNGQIVIYSVNDSIALKTLSINSGSCYGAQYLEEEESLLINSNLLNFNLSKHSKFIEKIIPISGPENEDVNANVGVFVDLKYVEDSITQNYIRYYQLVDFGGKILTDTLLFYNCSIDYAHLNKNTSSLIIHTTNFKEHKIINDSLIVFSLNDKTRKGIKLNNALLENIKYDDKNNMLFLVSHGDKSNTLVQVDLNQPKLTYTVKPIDVETFGNYYTIPKLNAVLFAKGQEIKLVNAETGELIKSKIMNESPVFCLTNKLNSIILIEKNKLIFVDPTIFTVLKSLEVDTRITKVHKIFLANNEDYLCLVSNERVYILDIQTGKIIFEVISTNDDKILVLDEKGFYFNPQKITNTIAFNINNQAYPISELDHKYNRPDLILAQLQNVDSNLIKAYYTAYEKRLTKLQIKTDTNTLVYPSLEVLNLDALSFESKSDFVTLNLRLNGKGSLMNSINAFVNGIPIFGQNGVVFKTNSINQVKDTTIQIKLNKGENNIYVVGTNNYKNESRSSSISMNYTPNNTIRSKTFFIGIGINQFKESGHDLRYAVKDIRDLANKFKAIYGDSFYLIDTLFNKQVSLNEIKKLKSKLLNTSVDDNVIVAYSGHGLLNQKLDYYLSTYEVNFNLPEINGVPYEMMEWLLDSIPARKRLFLIDACHSGELDKDELIGIKHLSEEVKSTSNSTKAMPNIVLNYQKPVLGMKNSFELMQELFLNTRVSSGAFIIAAAGGTEFAIENDSFKNGVFTFSLLNILNTQDTLKVSELNNKLYNMVFNLTNGLQKPLARSENYIFDWEIK
jgi:hypothetical protein